MGESYLVEGAVLRCQYGSSSGILQIPKGHGYTASGLKKANSKDCKPDENIPPFGLCRSNGAQKDCREYRILAGEWSNAGGSSWKLEKVTDDTALTMDSFLLCMQGGIIAPESSGQGQVQSIDWNMYRQRYGDLIREMYLNAGIFGFDPVNLNTGNFVYTKEDLFIHGITKLHFCMTYNSMEEHEGGSIGEGWRHNYEISLRKAGEGLLTLYLGDGQRISFRRCAGNVYEPVYGKTGLLKLEDSGCRYVTGAGREYFFDQEGNLRHQKERNGNIDTFLYDDKGRLAEVQGANGGRLYYHYNREGNLYRVCDHTGREVRLYYKYRVMYRFVNSLGYAYDYGYNENLRMESVTTPRGVTGVFNRYDSVNRVVRQTTPDGGEVELRYDDAGKCTFARDQRGHITTYGSDDRFRNVVTEHKGSREQFRYNDNDQIIFYEDGNGNQTRYQYDERGRLSGVTDALGRQQDYRYDREGRLQFCVIDGKEVFRNIYNEKGRMSAVVDALGRMRRFTYDEKGLPESIIQPDGSSTRFSRDERGNILGVTYPDGVMVRYRYDALNRMTELTDAEGNTVRYQYDARDHLLSVTNKEGAVRRFSYDVSGRMTEVQDFDGGTYQVTYDDMGRPESVRDKEGRVSRREYDLAGNVAAEIFPSGEMVSYEYDRENRLTKEKHTAEGGQEAGIIVDYAYDPAGNLLKVEAGDGKKVLSVTSYEYDVLNRVVAVTDPAGGKTLYSYDRYSGRVSGITDPMGNRRRYCYDAAGELTEETDIKGNATRYTYDIFGKLTSVTDGAGRTTEYSYLPGGRLEKVVYPDGRQTGYEYDSIGQIKRRTDNTGYSVSFFYDSMGRIQKTAGSDGQEKAYTYDMAGHVTSVTDALGNRTEYAYTPGGKLWEVLDALGNRTEYTYDMADRLIRVCQHGDPEADRITEYVRNGFGQVVCVRDAAGREEFYSYDVLGRMTENTDRDGLRTAYTYTPDGRTESILYDDGRKVEFRYTPLGQPDLVRDWLGETRIERNCYGEPVSITDHAGRTVRYEWGSMGERRCVAYPDGTTVKMQYDELLHQTGFIRSAAGKEDLWIRYKYDPLGRLCEKRSSGGYHTSFCYDKAGRLAELKHEDTTGILDRYRYEYDAAGNKSAIHKERRSLPGESGSYRYTYDGLQRLTGVEKDGGLLRRYQYDPFGNRISMEDYEHGASSEFSYDILNRLSEERKYQSPSVPENQDAYKCIRYEYDGRGNQTGEYEGGILLHGYAYNAMNRLERAWNREGNKAVYSYNGSGQRTAEEKDGIREEYLLDLTRQYNNMLWLERDKKKQRFYWDSNVSVMEEEGRKPRYYLQDEIGSVLRSLYDNGNGDRYGYDEFGRDAHGLEGEVKTKPGYTRQGKGQPLGYTSYRYDEVGGSYFAQAREYRPESGRFLAEDLVGGSVMMPKTWNRYGYCWSNPVRFVDLNGRTPELPTLQLQPPEEESIMPDLLERLKLPEEGTLPDFGFDLPDLPADMNSMPSKNQLPYEGTYITKPDENATYYTYDRGKVPFRISGQFGTGLYGKIEAGDIEAELGFKAYLERDNQNWDFEMFGMEMGAALGLPVVGIDTGGRYITCPMLGHEVMESGWYFDPSILNVTAEEDGDIYFRAGLGLYVTLGGEVDIEINISECKRRFNRWLKQLFNNKD